MVTKSIVIEWRDPRTKSEKKNYAISDIKGNLATIYIKKKQCSKELVDTFFHEMAHVFFAFHRSKKRMSEEKEEFLAIKVGKIVGGLLE